jgi:hypothetical protein
MGERNPFIHAFALNQGRLLPSSWIPTDGEYTYVLGSELATRFDLLFDDYVEAKQDLDLTGINVVRLDSRIVQPEMPVSRNVAIDGVGAHTATLKRGEVLQSLDLRTNSYASAVHPGSETQLKEPFAIIAGSKLRIEVDGGGDVDIAFPASPPILDLTAQQVVAVLTNAFTLGGVPAVAQVGHDSTDPTVIITANSTGKSATFEVKDYPGAEGDANAKLGFFQKTPRPLVLATKIYGGDDLSAIIAPDASFSYVDLGLPLQITGATADPGNNVTNHIGAILSPSLAVLRVPVTDEPVGFDAVIKPCLWQISMHIDGVEMFSRQISSDRTVDTTDLAMNVSQLSGAHEVAFRLTLKAA